MIGFGIGIAAGAVLAVVAGIGWGHLLGCPWCTEIIFGKKA